MFIPIQTLGDCFALGIYDDNESAENAYIEYITSHEKFQEWFEKLKDDFNSLFKNLSINNIEDLKRIIFAHYDDNILEDEELMMEFWEERNISACGDIVREVSDKYPQRDSDAMDVAAHLGFSYDDTFGNHAGNLLFSIVYRSESKFTTCFDNYIPRMAKLYPLF